MTVATIVPRYRRARPDDVPALLALWRDATDWGAITAEDWRAWYDEAPYGPALVVVAEDEGGNLVGQLVFTPCPMWVDGTELPGVRASAPILHPTLRPQSTLGGKHPALELYRTGTALAREQGFATVYSLPDRRWIRFFDRAAALNASSPRQRGFYSCVAIEPASAPRFATTLQVVEASSFGDEFERLWARRQNTYPVRASVRRHPAWLRYKNTGLVTLEVRSARGIMLGYASFDIVKRSLADFFAADPDDLTEVLGATVAWLAACAQDSGRLAHLTRVSALSVPATAGALAAIGFRPVDFELGFIADALDARVPIDALAPGAWFLTTGD